MTTVGIIGLGYVGLPLAVAFAEQGREIVALDVDHRKVEMIAAGRSYIEDVPSQRLAAVSGQISASTSPAALADADAVIVCVPTPLSANREPELGPLVDAARALAGVLQTGTAGGARVDDMAGYDARGRSTDHGGGRLHRWAGRYSCLLDPSEKIRE